MIESKYILDILEGIIEGESYSDSLKSQIECLTVRDCEYTDAGVFVHFNHSEAITKFKVSFLRNSFLGYLLMIIGEDLIIILFFIRVLW